MFWQTNVFPSISSFRCPLLFFSPISRHFLRSYPMHHSGQGIQEVIERSRREVAIPVYRVTGYPLGGKCQPCFFLVLLHRRTPCTVSSSPGSCPARASASVRTVARRPVGNRYTVPQARILPLVSLLVDSSQSPQGSS